MTQHKLKSYSGGLVFSNQFGNWTFKTRADLPARAGGAYAAALGTGEVSLGSIVVASGYIHYAYEFFCDSSTSTQFFVVVDGTTVAAVRAGAGSTSFYAEGNPVSAPVFGVVAAADSTVDVRYTAGATTDVAAGFLTMSKEASNTKITTFRS